METVGKKWLASTRLGITNDGIWLNFIDTPTDTPSRRFIPSGLRFIKKVFWRLKMLVKNNRAGYRDYGNLMKIGGYKSGGGAQLMGRKLHTFYFLSPSP